MVDLRIAGGAEVRAVVQQPKRFALLAYLAIAARSPFELESAEQQARVLWGNVPSW